MAAVFMSPLSVNRNGKGAEWHPQSVLSRTLVTKNLHGNIVLSIQMKQKYSGPILRVLAINSFPNLFVINPLILVLLGHVTRF